MAFCIWTSGHEAGLQVHKCERPHYRQQSHTRLPGGLWVVRGEVSSQKTSKQLSKEVGKSWDMGRDALEAPPPPPPGRPAYAQPLSP